MKNTKVSRRLISWFTILSVMIMLLSGLGSTLVSAAGASSINISGCSTYANFETIGVIIKVDNMNYNETASIQYKKSTDSTYKTGLPLTRIDGNHMATSLFNLAKNQAYNITVTLSDPDGVSTNTYTSTVTTKAEYVLPTGNNILADPTNYVSKISGAHPGDVIQLAAGTYNGLDLTGLKGTAAQPIVITSQSPSSKPLFKDVSGVTGGISMKQCDYIVFNNLEVHNEKGWGIALRGCHDCVIKDCYVHDAIPSTPTGVEYTVCIGITHSEESSIPFVGNNLILNNIVADEVHDPVNPDQGPGGSNIPVANGQCYDGITFLYQPGSFNTVRGNVVRGTVDGISLCGNEDDVPVIGPNELDLLNTWHEQNMDCYDNIVYNCKDDAIQNDGHMVNERVFRNRLGRCQCSITTAPFYAGPVYFVWNTASGFNENCLKSNTRVAGGTRNCFFYNNTFIEKDRSDGTTGHCFYRGTPAWVSNMTYMNNVFLAQKRIYDMDLSEGSYTGTTLDYNTSYTLSQDPIVLYKNVDNSFNASPYYNLSDYNKAPDMKLMGHMATLSWT